jgi:hypothetical protein
MFFLNLIVYGVYMEGQKNYYFRRLFGLSQFKPLKTITFLDDCLENFGKLMLMLQS